MAEEGRLFLRTALYASIITVVYWFVSYEVAGTFLLGFVLISAAFFVVAASRVTGVIGGGEKKGRGWGKLVAGAKRILGFEEQDRVPEGPLTVEQEALPSSSVWPPALALGALLIGLGAVYGGWFLIPGLVLSLWSLWGWLTQLEP